MSYDRLQKTIPGTIVECERPPANGWCTYLADFLELRKGVVIDYTEDWLGEGPRCLVEFRGTASPHGNNEDGTCAWWVPPAMIDTVTGNYRLDDWYYNRAIKASSEYFQKTIPL